MPAICDDLRPVLIAAFNCEPGRGSEPGIGWAHAVETARHRPVWLLCHPMHQGPLDRGIIDHNRSGDGHPIAVRYVDVGPLAKAVSRLGYFGLNLHYYTWVRAASRAAVELHKQVDGGFALAQHVSLCRWWMPTPAAALARHGVPFVWGPVGAGECMPLPFRRGIGLRGHFTELCRSAARRFFSLDPDLKRCARLATIAVAEPDETARRLMKLGCATIERAATLPADPDRMASVVPMPKKPGIFRIVSGGGLVYWKSFHLSVRAFAEAFGDDPTVEYVHVCGGEQTDRIRREADRLGVGDRVTLAGEMPHGESLRWVASADVYALPTLRDTTGHLFDALAAGVPCVASDRLSARTIVDATCGRRVSLAGGPDAFVSAMARAFRQLRDDRTLHAELSAGARVRARSLDRQHWGDHLRALQAQAIAAAASPRRLPSTPRPTPLRRAAAW